MITGAVFSSCFGQLTQTKTKSTKQVFGIIAALVSVVFNGMNYVVLNSRLRLPNAPDPFTGCLIANLTNTIIYLVYFFAYVNWNWADLVTTPISEKGFQEKISFVISIFISMALNNGLHQLSWYAFLSSEDIAAVTAGVIKAITAASVFFLSHFLFCNSEPAQCINSWKIIGSVGVVFGVLVYTFHDKLRCKNRNYRELL